MLSKEKVMKILEELTLDELHEAQSFIDNLITRKKASGSKSQGKADQEDYKSMERRDQERFYEIFPCKLKIVDKQEEPTFGGTVVDISKGGLRLKTSKKIEAGSVLVLSPDYDRIYKKIFVEVVRIKEFMGQYEIGVKYILVEGNTKK
ncbi:MAG: PilZ domain-containing protein [Candidatus Brocadiaceae bacterium]|nr:PilZ domain-containing protein [Candidatus Brocadiaceae bacterium]